MGHVGLEDPPDPGCAAGGESLRSGVLEGTRKQGEHQRRRGQLPQTVIACQGRLQYGERVASRSEMLVDLCGCEGMQGHSGLELKTRRQLLVDLRMTG